MRKYLGIAGLAIVAALAFSGLASSSASASLLLTCYKVSAGDKGNWKNSTCTESAGNLKGEYILAEPIAFIKENLWCAKITPEAATGTWSNKACTEKRENGEYIEAITPGGLPELLPVAEKTREWTGANEGEPEFMGSLGTVKCAKATAEGTEEVGKPLGAFHIHFSECKLGTTVCTGSGESAGVILALGTWHLVFDLNEPTETFVELATATLFLVEPTTFSCGALVKSEVKGEQVCLDLEPSIKKTTHSFHCIAEGTKQTEKWCMLDDKAQGGSACEEPLTPLLLTSINKAAFKESAELALGNDTYEQAVFADVLGPCYKVSTGDKGNWKNSTCTESAGNLKGEYVLAEPITFIKENLWCAKITPAAETGLWKNAACTERKENGEYIEIIVPKGLPEILPVAENERTWTGASEGTIELRGSLGTVVCEKATVEGTEEAGKPLGAFHIHVAGCNLGTTVCTGAGESAGIILTLGTWHLVFDTTGSEPFELTTAILFLVEATKFSCGTLISAEVKGELLCLDLKATESNRTHSFHCLAEGMKQIEKWCMLDDKEQGGSACEEALSPLLLTSVNKGTFGESAWLALGNDTYGVEVFADV